MWFFSEFYLNFGSILARFSFKMLWFYYQISWDFHCNFIGISFNFHWFSQEIGQFYYQNLRSQPKSIISICVHFWVGNWPILVHFVEFYYQIWLVDAKSIIFIFVPLFRNFGQFQGNIISIWFKFILTEFSGKYCFKFNLISFCCNLILNWIWCFKLKFSS